MTNFIPNTSDSIADNDTARNGLARFLTLIVSICLALALISFDPDDINFFLGGIPASPLYPKNLLGKVGAYTTWYLLLTFGLATHGLVVMLFLSSLRRFFLRNHLRSISWDYCGAMFLFVISLSLLLATKPNLLPALAARYNLTSLPGGVIGQRIGHPESGWLHLTFNTTGTLIVALICLGGSFLHLWFYDWAPLFSQFFQLFHSDKPSAEDSVPMGKTQPAQHAEPRIQPAAAPTEIAPAIEPAVKRTSAAPAPQVPAPPANVSPEDFHMPPVELLNVIETEAQSAASAKEIQKNEEQLQHVLDSFGVEATVMSSVAGPQVTLIKISIASGIKVDKISSLENNIKMMLCATSLRILAPIPGENLVGVEVPNKVLKPVTVRSLLEDPLWLKSKYNLPLLLGKNISGKTIIIDLAAAPHLLIAGATGAGKSVCMNVIIISLLYKYSPEDLKLIMVDPKMVEFAAYQKLPHLLTPVIFEPEKVAMALKWAVREMERRLGILQKAGCRDLESFNNRPTEQKTAVLLDQDGNPIPQKLPYIIIIIDELADIMATAKNDVETALARIAAKARAAGIHVIIATQRPDVKVITGTIKSNFPVRIAFRVASATDSMTILGGKGAESLLGKGDMLYKSAGIGLERIQGAMAQDEERNRVVEYIAQQMPQSFDDDMFKTVDENGGDANNAPDASNSDDVSEDSEATLYRKAVHIVVTEKKTSISYLQRRLSIGFNKAASLIEQMEQNGIVSAPDASNRGNRELLVTSEDDLPNDM